MTTYQLGVSSADAVTLYPEYDYKGGEKQIRKEQRTQSGRLFLYKYGQYKRFQFKVEYMPAADAALVNSWWGTNTELLFFITSETVTEVHSVMLLTKETPLQKFNKPYNNYYKGKILLEGY